MSTFKINEWYINSPHGGNVRTRYNPGANDQLVLSVRVLPILLKRSFDYLAIHASITLKKGRSRAEQDQRGRSKMQPIKIPIWSLQYWILGILIDVQKDYIPIRQDILHAQNCVSNKLAQTVTLYWHILTLWGLIGPLETYTKSVDIVCSIVVNRDGGKCQWTIIQISTGLSQSFWS